MMKKHKKGKKLSSDELSLLCDQIAMLLHGGIPINEGIYILCQELEDNSTKEILNKVEKFLNSRIPFYQALQKTNAFPDYMIHLIHVGEATGKIEDVMYSLSEYYNRESKLKADIRSAVMYPLLIFIMMTAILSIFVFKILPIFESMYKELSLGILSSSDNLMTFGINMGITAVIVTGILTVFIIGLFLLYHTQKGNIMIKNIGYNMKFTHKILDLMATGKFITSMSLMISTGMETRKALELAFSSNCNNNFIVKIKDCIRFVEDGMTLENAICKANLLHGMEAGMLKVAVKSGTSDLVFKKLSEKYNEKIAMSMGKISVSIETLLVIILTVLLGIIMLSVMLPLINIISYMG
jgi:type IV pilus assembly protein PilC